MGKNNFLIVLSKEIGFKGSSLQKSQKQIASSLVTEINAYLDIKNFEKYMLDMNTPQKCLLINQVKKIKIPFIIYKKDHTK